MKLQVKNWSKHQHYKNRLPPWIKLHSDLLRDIDFMCLPLASKALAPLLWLLASETKDGVFDASMEVLMFRLHMSKADINSGLKPLIDKGYFSVASGVLADCKQLATPETETETETEKKINAPEGVSNDLWKDFLKVRKTKRLAMTETAMKKIEREAVKANMTMNEVITLCCEKGWGGFEASWDRGVKTEKPAWAGAK